MLSISLLNLFTAANNKGPYHSARMHRLIHIFVISPNHRCTGLSVSKLNLFTVHSKQQRSISQCANAHANPYLCYLPKPQLRRIGYFLAKSIYCSKQYSPYHSARMCMLICTFVISQTPHMHVRRLFYFFVLIWYAKRNHIDDNDNNNYYY